ncbi:MAG: hypothetical protein FJW88_01615 [Actinobacteria bacterium]|nr:hypothetical protein [Actinomycetota bacterium]
MLLYGIALLLAVLVVPLTGGEYRRLGEIELHRWALLFAGLGIQVALEFLVLPEARWDDVGLALLLGSYVCILGFCLSNLRTAGIAVITIGVAMNAFVIALNQGMPYETAKGVGFDTTVKHRPVQDGDVLVALADSIPLGEPFRASISFGDLVVAVGLIDLAYRKSCRPRRARVRTQHPAETWDIDLAAYERWLEAGGNRGPDHDPFESTEYPRVVDVSRT